LNTGRMQTFQLWGNVQPHTGEAMTILGGPIPQTPGEAWHDVWIGGLVGCAGLIYLYRIRHSIPPHQKKNVPFFIAICLLLIGTWAWGLFRR